MLPDQIIDIIQHAAVDDRVRALADFFRRLENHFQLTAFDDAFFNNFFSGRQRHCRVAVMTAAVDRDMLTVDDMSERIHVGAYGHRRTGFAAVEDADDTGVPAQSFRDVKACFPQRFGHEFGRFMLLQPELRDGM